MLRVASNNNINETRRLKNNKAVREARVRKNQKVDGEKKLLAFLTEENGKLKNTIDDLEGKKNYYHSLVNMARVSLKSGDLYNVRVSAQLENLRLDNEAQQHKESVSVVCSESLLIPNTENQLIEESKFNIPDFISTIQPQLDAPIQVDSYQPVSDEQRPIGLNLNLPFYESFNETIQTDDAKNKIARIEQELKQTVQYNPGGSFQLNAQDLLTPRDEQNFLQFNQLMLNEAWDPPLMINDPATNQIETTMYSDAPTIYDKQVDSNLNAFLLNDFGQDDFVFDGSVIDLFDAL